MGLLYAVYMAGAAAVAVPLILHMLRRKPNQVQPFPSFMFFDSSTIPTNRRNNLRKWLLLAMRCLIFTLLALAFAWPYIPRYDQVPQNATAVLWDSSFSMDAAPYRDELIGRTDALLDSADQTHPVALGVVGDSVEWVGEVGADRGTLLHAFDGSEWARGASRFDRAIRQADLKLSAVPCLNKRIVVVTDRQLLPWQDVRMTKPLSPGTELEVIFPNRGKNGFDNVAILSAGIDSAFVSPLQRLTLRVRVRNFTGKPVSGTLNVQIAQEKVASEQVSIDAIAERSWEILLPQLPLEPQGGRVELVVADDVRADNECYFPINPSAAPKVALAPAPQPALEYVRLAISPHQENKQLGVIELSSESRDEDYAQADVIVVCDAPKLDTAMAGRIQQRLMGGATVVCAWRDSPATRQWLRSMGVKAQEVVSDGQPRRLAAVDFEHPLFAPFLRARVAGLFNVLFFDPPHLSLPQHARVIAQYSDGAAAIAEMDVGEGKLLIIASSMSRSATDWPAQPSFLPFWRYVLNYASRGKGAACNFAVSNRPLGQDVREVRDGGELVKLRRGQFVPTHAGNYAVTGNDGRQRIVSVNVPSAESDPLTLGPGFDPGQLISKDPPKPTLSAAVLRPEEEGKSFWWLVFAAAGCLLVSEMLLANRTTL